MEFSIINGIISKTATKAKKLVGRTDLLHILKQMLDRLGIQYTDSCCPPNGATSSRIKMPTAVQAADPLYELETEVFDFVQGIWVSETTFKSNIAAAGANSAYFPKP